MTSRTALITGAGSGIGRAIALALAADHDRLVLVGRREGPLHDTAAAIGHGTVLSADLATEAGRERVAAVAGQSLRTLVCSTGAFLRAPLAATEAAAWAALDLINVHAPMLLVARCLPALRAEGGDVVVINSTAGLAAGAGTSAYTAGKHALRAATDALRMELRGQGIRVLSVFPGRTDTPMQVEVLAAEDRTAPPGTLMGAEDVAAVVRAALLLPRRAEVTDITLRPSVPF